MTQDSKPKLHVVFNVAAAGTIREVLEKVGRRERVIGLADNLSFWPIDGGRPRVRGEWIDTALHCDFVEIVQWAEIFWRNAVADNVRPVVWLCREDAADYSGFLEFLRRRGDAPFTCIDVTGVTLVDDRQRTRIAPQLGTISSAEMIEAGLLDRDRELRVEELSAYRVRGARLRAENAPLRVIADGSLVSAPIEHFDVALLAQVTNDWTSAARVVGGVMAELLQSRRACVSDLWLWGRMQSLVGDGVLQFDERAQNMRETRVRIAA